MKRLFSGCLLVVLLLAGVAAYYYWRVSTAPRVGEAIPFAQLAPQEKERRRASAQKLTEDFGRVIQEAKRGENKKFVITANEEQLNTLLQDRLNTEKFPVRDLRVGLQFDLLLVQGRVLYKGFGCHRHTFRQGFGARRQAAVQCRIVAGSGVFG
jgi:hypothetical protein